MPDLPELPPIATQPLSVILLAHNAEAHLAGLVQSWREMLLTRNVPFEILIVDDGSSDQTSARADELAASLPELKVLRHEKPRGIGAALRTGLDAAIHPLLVTAPLHPNYRPEDLGRFLAEIDKVHFLTGYRAGQRVPFLPRILGMLAMVFSRVFFSHIPERLPGWLGWRSHLGAYLARLVYGVRLRDVGCPYRMFRREVVARSPLQSDGQFALVEQLAKVNFSSHIFGQEVPLTATPPGTPFPEALHGNYFREALRVFRNPTFGPVSPCSLIPQP